MQLKLNGQDCAGSMAVDTELNGTSNNAISNAAVSRALGALPIGFIGSWNSETIPAGWLELNGQAVSRTTYADLYALYGTKYGEGDGSTTFNLPDWREASPVGAGESDREAITAHDVYDIGDFKDDQLQGHKHSYKTGAYGDATSGNQASRYNNSANINNNLKTVSIVSDDTNGDPRTGSTTHGKLIGTIFIVKALDYARIPKNAIDDTKVTTANVLSASKVMQEIADTYIEVTCNSAADSEYKDITLTELPKNGALIAVTFSNGNTYGETTASTPTYPKLRINNDVVLPICDGRGKYAGKGFCNAGDLIELRKTESKVCITNSDIRESVQGESGYTIYSNDYFECWGKNTVSGTSGIIVTLPISYKDLTYKVFAQTSGTSGLTVIRVTIKTVNSFQLLSGVQTIGYYETTALWKTEGYI